MDTPRVPRSEVRAALRGAGAALLASVVMAAFAVAGLVLLSAPVTWPLVATVLAAALGGPATLTGSVDTGFLPVALQGTVDVVPIGVAGPGALVFCATLLGSPRTPLRILAVRGAGALGAAAGLLLASSGAAGSTVTVDLPLERLPAGTALTVRPGSAVLTGLLAVVVLTLACGLVTRLPYRRTVATVALAGPAALVVVGLVVAALVSTRQPALAGAAVLFGVNALLVALGASSPTSPGGLLGSRLDTVAGRDDWVLGGAVPAAVGLTTVTVLVLVCGIAVALVPPGGAPEWTGRWARAGGRALITGTVLATTLTVAALVGGGTIDLGVSLAAFRTRLLGIGLDPHPGWALLAGAVAGGVAGLLGSLTADVRWRSRRRAQRSATAASAAPVATAGTGAFHPRRSR